MSIRPSSARYVKFAEIKEKITFEQILSQYGLGEFRQEKDSLIGRCPIHKGRFNPNQFHINLTRKLWNCFGDCKRGGNILDFVALMEGLNPDDKDDLHKTGLIIKSWFPEIIGQSDPSPERRETKQRKEREETPATIEQDGVKVLTFKLKTDPTHQYLKNRGLTAETIKYFELGFASKGIMRNRIAIPIYDDQGYLLFYTGRAVGDEQKPRYFIPEGSSKSEVVFNLNRAIQEGNSSDPLIIVEGFFPVFWLFQNGYRRAVSLMGSSMSDAQEALLLKNGKAFYLMLDNNEAGKKGTYKIAHNLITKALVRIIMLPNEQPQPDHLTPDQLKKLLG